MKITGSQVVIECLVEQGVDTIFGYPGGAILNIYDELYKNSDRIRHILTAHEQGAAHAADGFFYCYFVFIVTCYFIIAIYNIIG